MVESTIVDVVRRYLAALSGFGIHAKRAVLFGSHARGDASEWSDIDLIIIAPELDGERSLETVKQLWRATAAADDRIEPIPCGEREWDTEGRRPILDIARKEGVIIAG